MRLVEAAGLGLGLGVVTGMPLGVINMAIVDAATAGRKRFAIGLGLGGGVADAIHALLAFAGVGRIITADPTLVRGLAIGAAVAIAGYTVIAWRTRSRSRRFGADGANVHRLPVGRGIGVGFLLTLPNPAALGAWVAVAASVWPDARTAEAGLIASGVGAGSAVWFALLATWLGRVRRDHPALAVIPRAALILLLAIAALGVIRVL